MTRTLAGLLCAAFLIRLAVSLWWEARLPAGTVWALGDSESYWELARAISRGGPYVFPDGRFQVFRAPGYPAFLSILFLIWPGNDPPVLAARCLGAVFGTVAVYQVVRLGTSLFDRRVGLTAGFLAALYPGAVAMSVLVLSESLFVPLTLAAALSWHRAAQTSEQRHVAIWASVAGGWCGLAALTRPDWMVVVAAAMAAVGFDRRLTRPARGAIVLFTLSIMVLFLSPWWIRNARVTGHFVPTTLQVGASLYDGLNPRADGGSNMSFATEFRRQVEQELVGRGERSSFEWELDRRYRRAAWKWAFEHPDRAIRLGLAKLRRTWQPWPQGELIASTPGVLAVSIGYLGILIPGLLGLIGTRRGGWICWLPLIYAVVVAAMHVVFVGSIRYRQPVMVWWTVPAAWALCHAWSAYGRRHGAATRKAQVGHESE